MHSFLIDAVVEFAGSVGDAFIEFLFAPRSRFPSSIQTSFAQARSGQTPSAQSSPVQIPSPEYYYSPASHTSSPSNSNPGESIQRELEYQRKLAKSLQGEINHLRDTVAQGMVILEKPSDEDVTRTEFLAQLWKALNQRDENIAHNTAVARRLQNEVQGLQRRNFKLLTENLIFREKAQFVGTTYMKFMDDPDSRYRELLNELVEARAERKSLIQQNRQLLEEAKQAKLITLRLVRSSRKEPKRMPRQ